LPASAIATRSGAPLPNAHQLAGAIKTVLTRAIDQLRHSERSQRFVVYDREGERCRRRGCTGRIRRIIQAGRATFYCPVCQSRRK
jgi:formamidopyrimidine-DNA glycosylase